MSRANGEGVSRAGRGLLGEAFARSWGLVVALAVVGAVVTGVAVLQRNATYTATSELNVGSVSPPTAATGGYSTAAQALTLTYSRAVDSPAVIRAVSHATGIPPGSVAAKLSASPVPISSIVAIRATGPSQVAATRLCNAATSALVRYAELLASASSASLAALTASLRTAIEEQSVAERSLVQAQAAYAASHSAAKGAAVDREHAALALLDVRVGILTSQYKQLLAATSGVVSPLTVFVPARAGGSNRSAALQQFGVAGAIAGGAIGFGLAMVRERRRRAINDRNLRSKMDSEASRASS